MRVPILGYHKVGAVSEFGRRLNVEASRLDTHVRFFARRGYRFVCARELARDWKPKRVAFTFDDGFQGAVELGLPCLERHGGVGTVYVVTGQVGGASRWLGEEEYPLAGWDALRAAAAKGHEVGNHTRTHARLGELDPDTQAREVRGATEDLEREGLPGGSFCLPYGSSSPETREILRGAGYQVCVTIRKAIAQDTDDPLALPRIFVAYGDALPLLLYRLYVRPKLP
ncbi:MAG TPA: polysaccharide deacetylase family protein [Fimbriimonadaceae bacterium]|nr:polysaccharide deacetylase family protein [Fimbriimonadaceae bacterium]